MKNRRSTGNSQTVPFQKLERACEPLPEPRVEFKACRICTAEVSKRVLQRIVHQTDRFINAELPAALSSARVIPRSPPATRALASSGVTALASMRPIASRRCEHCRRTKPYDLILLEADWLRVEEEITTKKARTASV
jgi:hypothetical protein